VYVVLRLELALTLARQVIYHLSHPSSLFLVLGFFQDRVSQAICLSWPPTLILLISVSSVVRITGVNHQHLGLKTVLQRREQEQLRDGKRLIHREFA
jgi:hypothetical protein